MGLAVTIGGDYPRWLGWIAVAAALGAFVSGAGRFVGVFFLPFPLLYGAFIVPLALWLGLMGLLALRHAWVQRREG